MDSDLPARTVRLLGRKAGVLVPAMVEEVLRAVGQPAPGEHGKVVEHPACFFSITHGRRSIRRAKAEHLGEISEQLDLCGPRAALDLEEVTVVGADVIRFLLARERQGIELLHCPTYIREWIKRCE